MIDWFKAFIIMFKAHKGQKDKGGGATPTKSIS